MTFLVLKRAVLGKEQSILDGETLVGLLHISLQLEMVTDILFLPYYYIILLLQRKPQALIQSTHKNIYKQHHFFIKQYLPFHPNMSSLCISHLSSQVSQKQQYQYVRFINKLNNKIQVTLPMSQKQYVPSTQKDDSSYLDIDTQFDDQGIQSYDHQQEIDLEENYIHRLKIQRKRIEQLSQLHQENQDKLKRQIEKNKSLQEEITRLSFSKEYQIKYNQISSHLESTLHQNKILKEQISTLREDIAQTNNEKMQIIQKLKYQLSLHKNKESVIIQNLQEELANKQDDYELLQREAKNREKQLLDTISTLKNKIDSIIQDHDLQFRAEQRKSQRLERDLQSRVVSISQLQNVGDILSKENLQMKEELFRCNSLLQNKQQQLRSYSQKYKYKLSSIKKQIKNKDKQLAEQRQTTKRQQKQNKDLTAQVDSLKTQIKKIFQNTQIERHRLQIDFNRQKQTLQMAINQHLATIQELIGVKNELLSENKKYITLIRKKQALQKQRKSLLRTQLKQLDKLQRVIDRIVQ